MNSFTYQNTTTLHFGGGQIAKITSEIPKQAKVLVLYGGGSIKKNGVYDQVVAALTDHNWGEFSGIEPNPQFDTLINAVAEIKQHGYTYLLAVGGGSVVDGAKFIAAAARYEGADAWQILNGATVNDAMPMGCILTLPATGSESNTGSVVSKGHSKLFFQSEHVRPRFAVLDPETTLSLSPRQSANGVVDAFVHVMEQYLTYPVGAKVQDRFAEGLLLTLMEEGPKVLETSNDLTVRANIMWAATQALNGLIGSGVPQDWTTHMIGHELTGNFGIDHARTLSIILPAVMKQRKVQKRAKLLQYAERVLGITDGSDDDRIDAAITATEVFFKTMSVPVSLSDAGLDKSAIDTVMATLKAHGRSGLSEHGDIDFDESRAILAAAL